MNPELGVHHPYQRYQRHGPSPYDGSCTTSQTESKRYHSFDRKKQLIFHLSLTPGCKVPVSFKIFTACHILCFMFCSAKVFDFILISTEAIECLQKQVVVILFTIKHALKLLNNIKTSIHYKPFFEVRISGFHMVHYIKAVTDNVEFHISR